MSQEELLQILECPVCIEYMSAPIYICFAGHSVCNKCKAKMPKCPTCRGLFGRSNRNLSLEHISAVISFPCPYEANGCTECTKFKGLKDHAKRCCFRPYACIKCDFQGPREALKMHLVQNHADVCRLRSFNALTWIQTTLACVIEVAFCFDEMFYITYTATNKGMYWACQFIGKSEEAAKFTYMITLNENDQRMYSFSGPCQSDLLTMGEIIQSGNFCCLPISVFKSFINSGKVAYRVSIEAKSEIKS